MKKLIFIALTLTLALNACSPFMIANASGEQPSPVVEAVGQPASVDSATTGYTPVAIDSVDVQVGTGSPIPVHVNISGNLPDTCAQVEYIEQVQDGSVFIIKVSSVPSKADNCTQDTLSFRLTLPLNVLDLPAGPYSVEVNGVRADFKLDTSSSTADLRTADMPIYKDDVQVDDVSMEIGVGSPIPVHAIVSGNLPIACGQLGAVQLHRADNTFFVRLIAHLPAQTDCNPDSLPFRLEIPLNIVNLPEGTYEVNINGATTTFDIPVQ
jgi:hypothetical protein